MQNSVISKASLLRCAGNCLGLLSSMSQCHVCTAVMHTWCARWGRALPSLFISLLVLSLLGIFKSCGGELLMAAVLGWGLRHRALSLACLFPLNCMGTCWAAAPSGVRTVPGRWEGLWSRNSHKASEHPQSQPPQSHLWSCLGGAGRSSRRPSEGNGSVGLAVASSSSKGGCGAESWCWGGVPAEGSDVRGPLGAGGSFAVLLLLFFLLLFLILLVKLYSISRWVELLKVEGRPGADLTGCSEMWQWTLRAQVAVFGKMSGRLETVKLNQAGCSGWVWVTEKRAGSRGDLWAFFCCVFFLFFLLAVGGSESFSAMKLVWDAAFCWNEFRLLQGLCSFGGQLSKSEYLAQKLLRACRRVLGMREGDAGTKKAL